MFQVQSPTLHWLGDHENFFTFPLKWFARLIKAVCKQAVSLILIPSYTLDTSNNRPCWSSIRTCQLIKEFAVVMKMTIMKYMYTECAFIWKGCELSTIYKLFYFRKGPMYAVAKGDEDFQYQYFTIGKGD